LTDRFTTTLFQTISVEKEILYRKLIPGRIELLTGAHTLLEQLHSANIQQAVGSSAPMENIDAILDSLHLRPFFKTTISAYNIPGKPNPAVFLKAAEELNVSPNNCIVIEDSTSGVEAAKRAGMKCVAVLTTHPAEKLQNADLVVNDLGSVSPENLVTIIKGG
ncbi:MAG: HAD family phosphatase, partial [Anaerolineales bacterium]